MFPWVLSFWLRLGFLAGLAKASGGGDLVSVDDALRLPKSTML